MTEKPVVIVTGASRGVGAAAARWLGTIGTALTHFTRVLAAEEPDVVSLAVRPGVVDTRMQQQLRRLGPGAMPAATAAYYLDLKRRGALEPAEVPGRAVAWLALYGPTAWTGRFLDYDDPEIVAPAVAAFGASLKKAG